MPMHFSGASDRAIIAGGIALMGILGIVRMRNSGAVDAAIGLLSGVGVFPGERMMDKKKFKEQRKSLLKQLIVQL